MDRKGEIGDEVGCGPVVDGERGKQHVKIQLWIIKTPRSIWTGAGD